MREKVLIFMLFVLLVIGTPDVSVLEQQHYPREVEYNLTQESMPIYRMITPEVNESSVSTRAAELFFMSGNVTEIEGIYVLEDSNRTFEVDSRDGSFRYADATKLWNISLGYEVPAPNTCKGMADTFLTERMLLPEGVYFLNIASCNATALDPVSEVSVTKILHHQVNYVFMKGDFDISETTASISVTIGHGGEIFSVDWSWRELELVTTSPVISLETICDKYGYDIEDVIESDLVIDGSMDDLADAGYAAPVYALRLETVEEDMTVETIVQIPATEFSPWATIITPIAGGTHIEGEPINFNATAINGLEPYTFTWTSSIDGLLSEEQAFTSILTSGERDDEGFPHVIHLQIEDAKGLVTGDFVEILVTEPSTSSTSTSTQSSTTSTTTSPPTTPSTSTTTTSGSDDPQISIIIIGSLAALFLLAIGLVAMRRRGAMVLLLLIMLLFSFTLLPPLSMDAQTINVSMRPDDSQFLISEDDAYLEVGIEWVGLTGNPPLPNTRLNIERFYNWMGGTGGYSKSFNMGEFMAWEIDFKYESLGGIDHLFVDAVDLAYYQDHGHTEGIFFSSNHHNKHLDHSEARWGDGDLEWIVLDACSPLKFENNAGDTVFERWGPALQGLHMICSFSTGSMNVQMRGLRFAQYLTFFGMRVINAWFIACKQTEGSSHYAAVLYASKSNDPWNPQLDDVYYDHIHGWGYVANDPTPSLIKWFVWISSPC